MKDKDAEYKARMHQLIGQKIDKWKTTEIRGFKLDEESERRYVDGELVNGFIKIFLADLAELITE